MSKFHITIDSKNKKTGEMIVVTSSKDTCPNTCPFKNNGCYANCGPLRYHWDKVSSGERGVSFQEFISKLKEISKGKEDQKIPMRLWQAGDLPGKNNKINFNQIKKLVETLKPFNAFGYTHKPLSEDNKEAIKHCNDNGVTINLSANNINHADELFDADIGPVTITVARNCKKAFITPKGRKVKICPATISDKVHCSNCGGDKPLCSRQRDYIIAFPAHGNSIKKVEEIVNEVRCE